MAHIGNAPFGKTIRNITSETLTSVKTAFYPTGGYTADYLDVFVNGVRQTNGVDFTATDGVLVTLQYSPTIGDTVDIISYSLVEMVNAVKRDGDTLVGTLNTQTLVPTANITYDIGTSTMRYRDLYLSGNTINLGDIKLSTNGTAFSVANTTGGIFPSALANTTITGTLTVNGAVTFANSTANTLLLSSAGIVGIGTSTANNTMLHVVGDWASGNSTIKVQGNTANLTGVGLYNASGARQGYFIHDTGYIGVVANNIPLLISTDNNSTNAMVVASNGFIGIGSSSPVTKFHLSYANGDYGANATSGFINEATSGRATMRLRSLTDNPIDFFFDVNQSARWDISARGSSESYKLNLYGQPGSNTYHSVSGPYVTVLQTGFVGIGNGSPTAKLHITGGGIRLDTSGYPFVNYNNTDSSTYFLTQFAENGTQKTYFGLSGSTHTGLDPYAAYQADGLSLNHDGAGRVTISNRGSGKTIWLCTGSETSSNFPTVILKNKMMSLPTQPRFFAYGCGGNTYVSSSYWIFPTVQENNGNHYNTSTGVFTVPTDGGGTYVFFWSNIAGNSNDVFRYYIRVNNNSIGDLHNRIDTTETGTAYGQNTDKWAMLNLAAGDTVRIFFYSDSGTASYPGTNDPTNYYATFGGYKIG